MEIAASEYWLASVLHDVSNIVPIWLTEKPIEFITHFDETLPGRLLGDEVRIRQVLSNLLSNAVKYTKAGSVTFSVQGELSEDNKIALRFEVADTGIGISPENMQKLFGEFEQFDARANKEIEGTGLGLAITKKLVNAMGGDVFAESEYGKGSVFTIVLPQEILDNSPIGDINAFSVRSGDELDIRFTVPEAKILIVDDNETNLKVAEGLLAPYKMQIDCCLSGEESVELSRENDYDIIFMDHMMLGIDGVEAAKIIHESRPKTPIVALTANVISGMREMFLENGFNDFLAKPIDFNKLTKILMLWLPTEKLEPVTKQPQKVRQEDKATFSIQGIDTGIGLSHTGGTVDGYVRILGSFSKDVTKKIELFDTALKEHHWKLYETYVHSFKGILATIGASPLSMLAAELERAASENNTEFCYEYHRPFIEKLRQLHQAVKTFLESFSRKESDELTEEDRRRLKSELTELKEAIQEMRAKDSDEIMESLRTKSWSKQISEMLEQIEHHILFFEVEDALAQIDCLLNMITPCNIATPMNP
jgi:signal transduction histidine kinase/AmiR/NasT family two-component response regulator